MGLFSNLFSSFLTTVQKNSDASGIQTRIVGVEGKDSDRYTNSTAWSNILTYEVTFSNLWGSSRVKNFAMKLISIAYSFYSNLFIDSVSVCQQTRFPIFVFVCHRVLAENEAARAFSKISLSLENEAHFEAGFEARFEARLILDDGFRWFFSSALKLKIST